jgi:hypothetical protein
MNDISQTKEGFIKSMILFIVLLGICFAPFFAFAENPASSISVNMQTRSTYVDCQFSTVFNCTSYAIEARNAGNSEYTAIMSCSDAKCMDASQTVQYSFDLNEFPYTEYRIRATDVNGNTHFAYGFFTSKVSHPIELQSNAVNETLTIQFNNGSLPQNFSYSLSNFNGETVVADTQLSGQQIDLNGLSQGFYIISFRTNSGETYHYKFLKQ